jgi:hypothetical protein
MVAIVHAQGVLGTLANNDSVFVDGRDFSIISGKSKAQTAAEIGKLGATELGAGALIFRSGDKLYIANTPRISAYLSDGDVERQRALGLRDADYERQQAQGLRDSDYARQQPQGLRDSDIARQQPQGLRDSDIARQQPQGLRETSGAGYRVYVTDPDYAYYKLKKIFDDNWVASK